MDLDSSANFLVGSILFGLACIVLTIAIVVINNILAKYWKPVKFSIWPRYLDQPPARFMTPEEEAAINRIPPTVDQSKPLDLSTNR